MKNTMNTKANGSGIDAFDRTNSSDLKDVIHKLPFVSYVIVSFVAGISLFTFVLKHSVSQSNEFDVLVTFLLFVILIVLFFFNLNRWKYNIPGVFLLIAVPSLVLFSLLILPDQVPDEIWHIYRVLNFTENGDGGMVVPDCLAYLQTPTNYSEMYEALLSSPDWESTHVVDRDMSSYLSHLYVIPGLFAALGETLNLNVFVAVYLARMANAALFACAGYAVIRMMPLGKMIALVYLLNPMLIQQESSCSADAFVNVVVLLYIAYVLKLRFTDGHIMLRQIVVLVVLLVLSCVSKFAYAPLALLLLLFVPRIKRRSTRLAIYFGTGFAIVAICAAVLLLYNGETFKYEIQLARSPIEFILVFLRTVYQMGPFWVESFGGYNLGALSINTWLPCFWAYGILLLAAIVINQGERYELNRSEKVFIAILVLAVVLIITLALRNWSVTHDGRWDIIMGVQGRYFIPIVILLLLCGVSRNRVIKTDKCLVHYAVILGIIIALDSATVVYYF